MGIQPDAPHGIYLIGMTIRLHLRRLQSRFLGLFAEVRSLRTMELRKNEVLYQMNAESMLEKAALRDKAAELTRVEACLAETKRELLMMSEARGNADRMIELLRGELNGIREISEREILGMRQTVDCLALQSIGRQVFGTAPQMVKAKEPDSDNSRSSMSIREAQRAQIQEFMEEVQRRGHMEPPAQPEYSSRQAVNVA